MAEPKYSFTLSEDALGVVAVLWGPGLPLSSGVHLLQPTNDWTKKVLVEEGRRWGSEAQQICDLLSAAYAAGQEARSQELRELLGVKL